MGAGGIFSELYAHSSSLVNFTNGGIELCLFRWVTIIYANVNMSQMDVDIKLGMTKLMVTQQNKHNSTSRPVTFTKKNQGEGKHLAHLDLSG